MRTVAGVRLTHPDRLLYPDAELTKQDMAQYCERLAHQLLPHLRGRPLSLVRCPSGVREGCFYVKHSKLRASAPVRRVRIQEKTKVGEYLIVDNLPALITLVQMNVVEIHTWNSTIDQLERPNRIVLDIDPGERVAWPQVIQAARLTRDLLTRLQLRSFVKLTGGRGVHVVVPFDPTHGWGTCLDFAREVARVIERRNPQLYTTRLPRAQRRGKILIDYLRNARGSTSVAAFSPRARPGAAVSVPIAWKELTTRVPSDHYTVQTLPSRLARQRVDPWHDYWSCRQQLDEHVHAGLARL